MSVRIMFAVKNKKTLTTLHFHRIIYDTA